MKIKTFLILTIVVAFFVAPYTTFAEEERKVEVVEYSLTDDIDMVQSSSVRRENVQKSYSRPNTPYDLSERYYVLHFPNVTDYTYSLVYFKPDSLGRVSIYTHTILSDGEEIMISLYRRSDHECVSTWHGDPQSIIGLGFNNLQTSNDYYFRFDVYRASSINGTGYIHHPDNSIPVN